MKKLVKDAFVPHYGNDYTPHILQRAAMLAMLGLVILTFTAANLQSLFWLTSDWLVSTILPGVIVELTNDERTHNGVGTLARSTVLDEAAQLKADHMARNQYFAHYSPDGVSPWYWFEQASYNYAHAGENLAIHFSDSDEVVEAWMLSPSHRANIVDGKFTQIGVGTARGRYQGYDTVYVVQLFGTPAVSAPAQTTEVVVAQTTVTPESEPVLAETITVTDVPEPTPVPESEFEPEPVLTIPDEEPTLLAQAEPDPEPPVIAEVAVEDESVSVYSETIATSSGKQAAPPKLDDTSLTTSEGGSFIGSMAVRPNVVLQTLYLLLGLFVLVALLMSILIEFRKQQPVQIAYALALLLVMSGLFYIHTMVTSGALVV